MFFVNFDDLSYHNYENIINLDYLFDQIEDSTLILKNKLHQDIALCSITDNQIQKKILEIHNKNFYTLPLNNK